MDECRGGQVLGFFDSLLFADGLEVVAHGDAVQGLGRVGEIEEFARVAGVRECVFEWAVGVVGVLSLEQVRVVHRDLPGVFTTSVVVQGVVDNRVVRAGPMQGGGFASDYRGVVGVEILEGSVVAGRPELHRRPRGSLAGGVGFVAAGH